MNMGVVLSRPLEMAPDERFVQSRAAVQLLLRLPWPCQGPAYPGDCRAMSGAKRIGILTSGGDCAGLNPAIRAVVHRATGRGWRVLGVRNGTAGLLSRPVDYVELSAEHTGGELLRRGGTIL